MKIKKIILAVFVFLMVSSLSQAQTTGLPSMENSDIFTTLTKLQNIYLTYYDRLCLTSDLDGIPIAVIAVQPDRFNFEAMVLRLDKKVVDMSGYYIKIQGDLAWVNPLTPSGVKNESAVLRNTDLWNIPVFSSQFHMGDFLPALFLQLKFSSMTESKVDGNPRIYLSSFLTVGEAKENREIVLELDKIAGVPKGFVVQSLNKKKIHSINITSYGNYSGKSYAREAEVTDYESGKKSKVTVQQMSSFKPGMSLVNLSTLTADNWKNFCNLDSSGSLKSSQNPSNIPLKSPQ